MSSIELMQQNAPTSVSGSARSGRQDDARRQAQQGRVPEHLNKPRGDLAPAAIFGRSRQLRTTAGWEQNCARESPHERGPVIRSFLDPLYVLHTICIVLSPVLLRWRGLGRVLPSSPVAAASPLLKKLDSRKSEKTLLG